MAGNFKATAIAGLGWTLQLDAQRGSNSLTVKLEQRWPSLSRMKEATVWTYMTRTANELRLKLYFLEYTQDQRVN